MDTYSPRWPVDLARFQMFTLGVRSLARRFLFSCTSWGRTPTHNASLTGQAEDSKHLEWVACDVVFDAGHEPVAGVFKRACLELGIQAEKESDHWHLEVVSGVY